MSEADQNKTRRLSDGELQEEVARESGQRDRALTEAIIPVLEAEASQAAADGDIGRETLFRSSVRDRKRMQRLSADS